jgi:RimJ/RimL family protein N-acetyltransferase
VRQHDRVHFQPDLPVETARLRLRRLTVADAADLHAYRSRPEVCAYVPFEPQSLELIAGRLSGEIPFPPWQLDAIDEEDQGLFFAVERRADGRVVGDVMLRLASIEHSTGEIGYVFNPDEGGQGYATEAVAAVLALGFEGMGLHRLIARLDVRNLRSAALAERLGMRREAHLVENEWFKGEWTDEYQYGLLRREWEARQGGQTSVAGLSDIDEHGRPYPPLDGDEGATLLGFLDYQRATFAWKCRGLDEAGMGTRIAASTMTMGGLLKHLAVVEDSWLPQRPR